MKKRLRVKYIILILIATSFLSVLYYINNSKIAILENEEEDYATDSSFFDNTLSLGTSNEIFWAFLFQLLWVHYLLQEDI